MVGRDKERASFLVARPSCNDDTRFLGSTPMIDEFLDSTVRPDEELPSISRRVAASLRRIFDLHSPRRNLPQPHEDFIEAQMRACSEGMIARDYNPENQSMEVSSPQLASAGFSWKELALGMV
jgi:hypothetical protein